MTKPRRGRVVVVGNEKGGSGKSTAAMHVIVGLMGMGLEVASVDLDLRQATLSRYLANRRAYAHENGNRLPMPRHEAVAAPAGGVDGPRSEAWLRALIESLAASFDAVVIDTPGSDTRESRLAHAHADTLLTPLNDSFLDLDVLARVDAATMKIRGPSHYAELVWRQRKERAASGGGAIDWVVMRNRLSSLDAHSKRQMARLLGELSRRIGFRIVPGFGERVIYRELFLKGLTILDLKSDNGGGGGLRMSDIAARQEVRGLIEALDPSAWA